MKKVFISSVQREFQEVRDAARAAVESLGMYPVMAETTGASADSPRRALLDLVRDADIVLLLLGARYGEAGETGRSPTEDEYQEAVRLDKPVIVLAQEVEMEARQREFLDRTRGSWDEGKLSGAFVGPSDAGLEIVKALRVFETRQAVNADANLAPEAQSRAHQLAGGDERTSSTGSGSKARFVAAPLVRKPLLDALMLEDAGLAEELQTLARTSGLVNNAMALTVDISSSGVRFEAKEGDAWETLQFAVEADGAVVAEGSVGGSGGHFSESVVLAQPLRVLVERAQAFTLRAWKRIDTGYDIRETALTVGIPNAGYKVYAESDIGGSMSMPAGLPPVLIAPEPARLVRREDLSGEATTRMLIAELKRRFADAGAVHAP
jgi:hypothetical protein